MVQIWTIQIFENETHELLISECIIKFHYEVQVIKEHHQYLLFCQNVLNPFIAINAIFRDAFERSKLVIYYNQVHRSILAFTQFYTWVRVFKNLICDLIRWCQSLVSICVLVVGVHLLSFRLCDGFGSKLVLLPLLLNLL